LSPPRPAPAFTGSTLDRAALIRHDPGRAAGLVGAPGASVVAATADAVLLDTDAPTPRLLRAPAHGVVDPAEPILLGIEHGTPLFAADIEGTEPAPSSGRLASLREAGALLPQSEGGLAAYLVALLNWHRSNRFCANCGTRTQVAEAGLSRHCGNCGRTHFPRTDPVVIMVVEHDGRLLLGRRAGWPAGQYSLLAGFVSPGETPEEAVIREVREESGIEATAPVYVASQPWPFPSSLMLGFEARSPGGTPAVGDQELEDVGWFNEAEVRAAHPGAGLRLPPEVSIARVLIDGWLARR
jgi:NAD+ diphosphatase